MKYKIEVLRADEGGGESVLHRVVVDEISPRRTRTRAERLLGTWQRRGASATRVLNHHGEELYRFKMD